jgi:hypothetical protein
MPSGVAAHAALAPNVDGADLFGTCFASASGKPACRFWRAALQLENLHPLYYGYCLHWYSGRDCRGSARTHDSPKTDAFRLSLSRFAPQRAI